MLFKFTRLLIMNATGMGLLVISVYKSYGARASYN